MRRPAYVIAAGVGERMPAPSLAAASGADSARRWRAAHGVRASLHRCEDGHRRDCSRHGSACSRTTPAGSPTERSSTRRATRRAAGKPRDPISFPQGARRVIAGWDLGFEGMKVGGQRRLFIPYQLAYGEAGRPPVIPPKAELIFDVELMAVADTLAARRANSARPAQRRRRSVQRGRRWSGGHPERKRRRSGPSATLTQDRPGSRSLRSG